jgi:hypothetical protein
MLNRQYGGRSDFNYSAVKGSAVTKEQEDAVYAAYMGISVLSTMCKKAGLNMGRSRAEELLQELSEAFPTVYERVLLSVLR